MGVKVNFIFGQLNADEIHSLKSGERILTKMILTPDDFSLFQYAEGDYIQVETEHGDRIWCTIVDLEKIKTEEGVLLIFRLLKS